MKYTGTSPKLSTMNPDRAVRTASLSRRTIRPGLLAAVLLVMLLAPGGTIAASVAQGHSAPAAAPLSATASIAVIGGLSVAPTVSLGGLHQADAVLSAMHLPTLLQPIRADPSLLKPMAHYAPAPRTATHVVPAGSTSDNWYVNGSECSQSYGMTAIGGNPSDLAESISSVFGFYNGTWPSPASGPWTQYAAFNNATPCSVHIGPTDSYVISNFTDTHGLAEIATSTDGGKAWNDAWLGQNNSWKGAPSKNPWVRFNNSLNNTLAIGDGNIASNADGTVLMTATTFASTCVLLWIQFNVYEPGIGFPCTLAALNNTTSGVASSYSTDGGSSWHTPNVLGSEKEFAYCALNGAYYATNVTESPTVEYDPGTDKAILTWDRLQIWVNCAGASPQIINEVFSVMHATSSNDGVNWAIGSRAVSSTGMLAADSLGPGSPGALNEVSLDYSGSNYTANGDNPGLIFSRSTNDGTSWTSPTQVVSGGIHAPPLAAPGTDLHMLNPLDGLQIYFFGSTAPTIATDNWSASPYSGYIYVAWVDNMTGNNAGYTGIGLSVSSNDGSSWSTPQYLSDSSKASTFWDPSLTVAPNGDVWLTALQIYASSANAREVASISSDGGASWSAAFPVADQVTGIGSTAPAALLTIGPHFGLVATTNGTFAAWTDGRLGNDTSTYDTEVFVSQLFASKVETNATSTFNDSDVTYGQTTKIEVSSASPGLAIWANGASHTDTVPSSVPYKAGSIYSFTNYSQLATGTNPIVTFSTSAVGALFAFYVPVPAATIAGTFSPNVTGASLTINGQAVPLHPNGNVLDFSVTLAGGTTYPYSASAGAKYTSVTNGNVAAVSGQTTPLTIALSKTNGTIAGGVSLAPGAGLNNTVVSINGTAVTLSPTGTFSVVEPWGYYFLNASNPRTSSVVSQIVEVSPGQTASVPIVLSGGWIQGNVRTSGGVYTGLTVTVNGSKNDVTVAGNAYNWSCDPNLGCPTGWYWVNASEPGYNTSSQYVQVVAGQATVTNLVLTDTRTLFGAITPVSVATDAVADKLSVEILNTTDDIVLYASGINPTTGTFNLTVKGGIGFEIIGTAVGYDQVTVKVAPVPAGVVAPTITLQFNASGGKTTTPCATTPCCNATDNSTIASCEKSTTNGNGGGSGLSTLDYAVIGIVVLVAIVAIAMVLLMRRRGGGGDDSTMAPSTSGTESDSDTYGSAAAPAAPANEWNETPPSQ